MRRKRNQGQALVELAIVLPILFLILSAIFDFGRITFVAVQMETVMEDISRYALRGHDVKALKKRLRLNLPKGVTFNEKDDFNTMQKGELTYLSLSYYQDVITVPMQGILGKKIKYRVKVAIPIHPSTRKSRVEAVKSPLPESVGDATGN